MPDPGLTSIAAGIDHHSAGRLDQAETIYRRILEVDPDHADARHLLGVIAMQRGDHTTAIDLISGAVQRDPTNPQYLSNLGTAFLERGATDEAIATYDKALIQDPDHTDTLYNLGNALRRAGKTAEAIDHYRRAVARDPTFAPAQHSLALSLVEIKRHQEALEHFDSALRADPTYPDAHANKALALQELTRFDEALESYRQALERQPSNAVVHNNLGTLYLARGELADAERCIRRALEIAPELAAGHLSLGNLHRERGALDEAILAYRQALRLDADFAEGHNNIANVLSEIGRHDAALAHLDRGLASRPDHAETLSNRGRVLRSLGRLDEAVAAYDRALAITPSLGDARFGRAIARLLVGAYQDGWQDYLARESMANADPRFFRARLDPDLTGRRLLVTRDQGLGDEIFFLRFMPELRSRGAWVAYAPDPRLVAMFERCGVCDAIVDIGMDLGAEEAPEPVDLRLAIGDLPYALGVNGGVPAPVILPPLEAQLDRWRGRIGDLGPPPYVGVTWRAGTRDRDRALFKEVPLDDLAHALGRIGGTPLVLQRLPERDEITTLATALGRDVHDLTALNDDLEAMIAVLALIDEYVCVSNTNVHLRSAQGRACRVLVPNPPEFRWMQSGTESPWFPGTRVYRQAVDGTWRAALDALSADLQDTWG